MTTRRLFLASLLCGSLAALSLSLPAAARAADSGNHPPLKDELEFDLRAKQPKELAFINRVVFFVEVGALPRELVLSTFQWARRKNSLYPFPYFEFAMRMRAKKIGVVL